MTELTKNQVKEILETVSEGLKPANLIKEYEYYMGLYPEDVTEADIAGYANQYPELHPLMVEVAQKISFLTGSGKVHAIWVNDEEQAGSLLTRALALYDKKYCGLFAGCLVHQDLDHEVYQNEYITDIINKWGLCEETGLILQARMDNAGQWGPDLISELLDEYGDELETYLADVELEFDEDDDENVNEEDDGELFGGHQMMIQDKRTLELLALSWDEDYPYLMITHNVNQMTAFKYESYSALEETITGLQQRCDKFGYAWNVEAQTSVVADMIQWGHVIAEQPGDVLTLFTPEGEQSALDKMIEEQMAGQKTIPCEKCQLYRGVLDYVILLCDPQGLRLLKMPEYENQFLWVYDTETELRQRLEEMKSGYRADKFEPVLEETLDYPFDYALEQTKLAAEMMAQRDADFEDDSDEDMAFDDEEDDE